MAGFKKIIAPDFRDGVDRKELKQIRERFAKVNQVRLKRAILNLSIRHQDILEVLPLLYDVNHPLLPGFVSRDTPRGVSGFEASKSTLSVAKSFSQTFKYRRERRKDGQVHSIFMMGSSGTLAQAESSDIDLWLCYDEGLAKDQVALLQKKAELIDQWAESQGLELHTFLIHAAQFRTGSQETELGGEHSGSAQHYMLLDEFYRTAIHLAGRTPLWWLIPPSYEKEYEAMTEMLLSKRFIKESEVIDFGSAADIPKGELLGVGLWQLYKSIDAPYKSVLKLLLAEVYAKELPNALPLSVEYKTAVYEDRIDSDELDPYYMIYQRLEKYLIEQKELRRLELVRKAFYLKVGKKLGTKPKGSRPSWQRTFMLSLVNKWGWSEEQLKFLDSRYHWKVDQVLMERQELVGELTYSYRFLSSYARLHGIISHIKAEDLGTLGRKLYARFQRKAGKIEYVNPGIAPRLWEENLAVHHSSSQPFVSDQHSWLLYSDLASAADAVHQQAIKKTASLIELLAWSYYNGLMNTQTRLSVMGGESKTTIAEVRNIVSTLEHTWPLPLPPVMQSTYRKPAYLTHMILFVNVGVDPLENLTEQGITKISDWNDSLGFSSQKNNLVSTIDVVTLNSWNEMSAQRYEKGETLIQNLQNYLQLRFDQDQEQACELQVKCFCPQRADAIARRVKELFDDTYMALSSGNSSQRVRYVIEIQDRYFVVDKLDNKVRIMDLDSRDELMFFLAQPQAEFVHTIIDRHALRDDPSLQVAFRHTKPGSAQAMFIKQDDSYRIFLVDETGALADFRTSVEDEDMLRFSLSSFYGRISERRQLREFLSDSPFSPQLLIYKLVHSDQGKWLARKMKGAIFEHMHAIEVQAIGIMDGSDVRFDLICQGRDFRFMDHRNRTEEALVAYLRGSGADLTNHRCIVTDIQLPDPMNPGVSSFRTLQYYQHKQEIESTLNQALGI